MAEQPISDEIRALAAALASGRLSRRAFLRRAGALGIGAPLAAALAARPGLAAGTPGELALAAAQATRPGPATGKIHFSAFNVDQAPLNIEHGDMDLYLFGLKTAAAKQLANGAPGVRLIQAPATTIGLLLNPAPAPQGDLNPFSLPAVRQAMQFLVNRDAIANDIYQGRAVPMFSHVSPLDPDELTVFETVRKANFHYDAEDAKRRISDAMTKAGAQLQNNVWSIGGRPIQLKFIVRVEDERRDIGDLIRAALEGVGFQVAPQYQQFGPALQTVQSTDPAAFNWHLYTEGYSRGAPDRYDSVGINEYAAPWLGNMPGWQVTGFWQYQNQQLDQLGQKLYRGQFKSHQERDDLYRQMTALALQESVRVWLVNVLTSYPVRTEVQNLTEDLVAGPRSEFSLREATIPGKDTIRVGHLWVWTEQSTWNPIGSGGGIYVGDIERNLIDSGITNHPFTGLPIPVRTAFDVQTSGPSGTLPVPADAVLWDTASNSWKAVGNGKAAVSKVTYDFAKFFQAPFHHGAQISAADLAYALAQNWELAYNEKKVQIETAIGVTLRPYLETFKGFRFASDTKFEAYVDYWHFEPSYIASYAAIAGVTWPWELLAAMDDVVFEKKQGAYSDTAAARFNVPWLSLTTDSDCRLIIRSLRQFLREKSVPKGYFDFAGKTLVSANDATKRYQACIDWFTKTNLLVISNGPYYLNKYDPPAQFAELLAVRDPKYPFKAGDFRFGAPQRLEISAQPPASAAVGQPISVSVTVKGPGKLAVKYVLVDPTQGNIATSGDAHAGEGGAFTVAIDPGTTGQLFPGLYQLYLLASSDAIAQVAEQRLDLQVGV